MTLETRVGTVIEDKFRLDEQIGQGSMGAVYRGTQLMVDRSVAVKLLHPNFAGHDKIQARFEVEAKAIARLNHPNCITLFDFGYSEDMEAFYTVVEYIDGISMERLINQRPSVSRIVELVRQTASALGHAHHHGILHRDLKPENIMLADMTDGSEIVKVLDFGIAQIMQGNTDDGNNDFETDRLTRVGEVFGTPPYMSPEQSQSTRDLTPATDLYSLGIIFYELLEGRLPFFAETPIDIMAMHINEEPPPMTREDVPESIKSIVFQMLSKIPEERPESGDEIVGLLNDIPDADLSEKSRSIGPSGEARQSDPTLMSAPPEPDATDSPAGPSPGEKSAVYELQDIVAEPNLGAEESSSPTNTSQRPTAPSTSSSPDATTEMEADAVEPRSDSQAPDALKSTQMLSPGVDDTAAISARIERHQYKTLALILGVVLLVGAGMIWLIVEYEPFSMADENELSQVADYAVGDSPASSDSGEAPGADTEAPAEDPDFEFVDEEPPPREIVVADPEEDSEGESDEEQSDESPQQEAEQAPRQRPAPQRTQEPSEPESQFRDRPRRLGGLGSGDDSGDTETDDHEESQSESETDQPEGPPRLGL